LDLMNKSAKILLLSFLLSPLTTFAHGEESLVPVLIDLVHLIILVIAIVTINLNLKGKLILATIYLLTFVILTLLIFGSVDYQNYLKNMGLINFILFIIPVTCLCIAYLRLEKRFKGTR
jgi:hypothetical protein